MQGNKQRSKQVRIHAKILSRYQVRINARFKARINPMIQARILPVLSPETKWKYDVAPEDKQKQFKQMILNFMERCRNHGFSRVEHFKLDNKF